MTEVRVDTPTHRTIVEHADCPRISALTSDGVEIAGAFLPAGHQTWHAYVTKLVTQVTEPAGLTPGHAHFTTRAEAVRWVEMIGRLYTQAVAS